MRKTTIKKITQGLLSLMVMAGLWLLGSCSPTPRNAQTVNRLPQIYPDYTDVTIPPNIAPLNFMLCDSADAVTVEVNGERMSCRGDNEAVFDEDEWHRLLRDNRGKRLTVQVMARYNGRWTAYRRFHWFVANDSIDPYLTYRLIEPDYEVWNHLVLQQRCVENFSTRNFADHNLLENRCMNCHTPSQQDAATSMLYVRGKGGGAILNRGGMLRKLNIQASTADHSMVSPSVYFGFAPGGRFIAFSSNVIIPAFHAKGSRRLEVYDSKSDVYVADLNTNTILLNTLTADSMVLETFPTISPDGRYLYYCAAPRLDLPRQLRQLRYALVRIPFDARTGRTGTQVDTLVSSRSVCHPRISPDGRHLVFTVADYGTFPIWHREADLWMLDLVTRRIDTLAVVNSRMSDTYHSWSSNSRWLVFASKRDDGLYGKPYFCYIDRHGKAHKPFVLPQRRAQVYDHLLKSFNAPELVRAPLPFDAVDVQKTMKQDSENFRIKILK